MISREHVMELEHRGDRAIVTCRRCGLQGETGERIAGDLIARHRRHVSEPWWVAPIPLGGDDG